MFRINFDCVMTESSLTLFISLNSWVSCLSLPSRHQRPSCQTRWQHPATRAELWADWSRRRSWRRADWRWGRCQRGWSSGFWWWWTCERVWRCSGGWCRSAARSGRCECGRCRCQSRCPGPSRCGATRSRRLPRRPSCRSAARADGPAQSHGERRGDVHRLMGFFCFCFLSVFNWKHPSLVFKVLCVFYGTGPYVVAVKLSKAVRSLMLDC